MKNNVQVSTNPRYTICEQDKLEKTKLTKIRIKKILEFTICECEILATKYTIENKCEILAIVCPLVMFYVTQTNIDVRS